MAKPEGADKVSEGVEPLTKITAARRQLATAIVLHFEDRDAVSVHTLAHAAAEVANTLCRHRGIEPYFDRHHKRLFVGKTDREIKDAFSRSRNFMKHADRDSEAVLESFSEADNDYVIFMACFDMALLDDFEVNEFLAYYLWFVSVFISDAWNMISGLLPKWITPIQRSRSDHKASGLEMISMLERDPDVRRGIVEGVKLILARSVADD